MNTESRQGPQRKNRTKPYNTPRIRETGVKGAKDRERAIKHYHDAARFFKVKPVPDKDLAIMTGTQIYHLGEDLFNKQSLRRKEDYFQYLGLRPRANPKALKWYIRDTIAAEGAAMNQAEQTILVIAALFKYCLRKIKGKKIAKIVPYQPAKEKAEAR
jgi:hypothetical protein